MPLAVEAAAAERPPLELVRTIPMPAVEGRIDHMAADVQGHRLFVAALGNNTLEVLDLKQGKRLHTITGLHEPQGVAYLPRVGRIVVANGAGWLVPLLRRQDVPADRTDRLQGGRRQCSVRRPCGSHFCRLGEGALAEIDLTKLTRGADTRLPGHPELFQLESQASRIFVNVPDARQVIVVDRKTGRRSPMADGGVSG